MSIAWATVEDALTAWVKAGSGLPTGRVIWSQQNGPRPAASFVSLRIIAIQRIGQDWLDVTDAPAPAPELEIMHRARGQRVCSLSIQTFAGSGTGDASPAALLDAIQASAAFDSRRTALNAAGIGLASFGPVQTIDGIINSSVFEPRATLEARFFLASEVTELGTYIETVEVENLTTGGIVVIP